MKKKLTSVTTTYHRSYSYGAILQAYALQQTLLDLGFENRILDFPRSADFLRLRLTGNIRTDVLRLVIWICSLCQKEKLTRLYDGFDEFITNNLLTTRKYASVSEIEQDMPIADCFITGSDQVFTLREDTYTVARNMLAFGDSAVHRYSYAASLADYNLSSKEKETMSRLLQRFSRISVREKDALDYLSAFAPYHYETNVDPVFLLNENKWRSIEVCPKISEPYILYFQVNGNPIANSVLTKIKKELGLRVVCIQTTPFVRVRVDSLVIDATPQEFIGWVDKAGFVVTTSFHGTAFAIVFRKKFYTITKQSSNPTRIYNLLSTFALEDRLITNSSDVKPAETIGFDKVFEIVEECRHKAIEYLTSIEEDICARVYMQ